MLTIAIPKGRLQDDALELLAHAGVRLSEEQLKEMDRITAAGGLAFVAHSFPEFLEWWQSLGFTIPEIITNQKIQS